MRLLITGGCGFLGHHLVEHFAKLSLTLSSPTEIVILDKLTYASHGFDRLRDIKALDIDKIKVLGCDLAKPIPQGIAREIGTVDYVIHAAAETHVDNSITNPLPFYESNVIGTHNLLWWLAGKMPEAPIARPKRIYLVSTDEVYGPAAWDSPGNSEDDPFRPANPYAAAKAGAEAIGLAYANTYRLPITVCKTMNLYGERQHFEKFVPLVIRSVIDSKVVKIHADPTRTRSGTRFYIHCRNFASALEFLIQRNELGHKTLKVHVAGEREVSNLDLAQLIAEIVDIPLRYELVDFHSSRPGHDLRYALSDTKIRNWGWSQPVDFAASMHKTVKWYLDNPRWLYP